MKKWLVTFAAALRMDSNPARAAAGGNAHRGENLLRADVVGGVCYALTGQITPSGVHRFEIAISSGFFTTVYETRSYGQAQRCYARILRGKFPIGFAAPAHTR